MSSKSVELEKMVNQLVAHRRAGIAPPMSLLERFREVAKLEGGDVAEVRAALLHTVALKNEGRFVDAFEVFETFLRKYPDDLVLQSEWNQFRQNTLNTVESRLSCNPWDVSMAKLYDKFVDLGEVTIRLHVIMIEHYRLVGVPIKAAILLTKVLGVAPNYPGIQETVRRLKQGNV